MKILSGLVLAFGLLLSGCGEDPVLPAYEPLSADESALSSLYKLDAGDHKVLEINDITLQHADARELPLRVLYPEAEGEYPVVLFSHGNWSDQWSYDRLVKHWVSHGYIVLLPLHLDGKGALRGIFNSVRYGQMGLIQERIKDIGLVFQQIDHWASDELRMRMDLSRIAATGHSFGAFSAQQLGGARALDVNSGEWYRPLDERFKAVIGVSAPGPMFDTITADSWQELQTPTLITTGTWDVNKSFFPQWELHRMSYDRAPAGDKYALVVQGADHYHGNLLCRLDREVAPQHDQLKILRTTTTAFLDAYVKDDASAMAFIRSDSLSQVVGAFASLSRK